MIDSGTNTIKLRPQTGRVQKVIKSKSLRSSKNSFSTSSIEETSSLLNDNLKDEKIKFFEELCQKKEFENLINEEADRIDLVNQKKKILNTINLYEKNNNELYNWKTLFNNSKPISSYIKGVNEKNEKEEEKKEKDFKFPVVLVDLNENQLNYFLQNEDNVIYKINRNNKKRSKTSEINLKEINYNNQIFLNQSKKKKKNGNCIRPMSINSKINKNDTFYFSQNFSDYFKEDLKDFAKKMPLLKPKIIQDPTRLKKVIKNSDKESEIKEKKLKKIINSDTLILNRQDVIIAGKSNNPNPLLKSIFRQIHPESSMKNLRDKKLYLKTMKTIDKNYSVDFIKNKKKKLVYNGINSSNNNGLLLSTYNKNDPALAIFNKIKEENEEYEELENVDNKNNKINKEDQIINIKQQTILNNNKSIPIKIKKINPNLNTKSSISEQIITNDTSIYNQTKPKTVIKKGKNKFNQSSRIVTSTNNMNIKNRIKSASNISTLNTHQSTDSNLTLDHNFIPQNFFPLRLSSGIINVIYSKINQRLHFQNSNKNEDVKKLNNEMKGKSLSTRNLKIPNNINYKEFNIIQDNKNNSINNNLSKWDFVSNKDYNNQFISCFSLNDYIDSVFVDDKKSINKDKINYFYPLNYFNKNSKILSCSNNVTINAKRNKKKEIIDRYYNEGNYFNNNKKRRLKSAH